MLRDARLKRFHAIIIHKVDRFARNAALLLRTVEEMEHIGIAFLSAAEQVDFRTPMGKMLLTMLAGVAEYYSNNLATETSKGLVEKAQQGGWVGPTPYGYRRAGATLALSDDAPAVRRIFDLYASGQHSFTSIADDLNAHGWRTLDWQTGKRGLFGRESIRYILGNKAYLGVVTIHEQEYPGQHPPLVDQATWDQAQAIRAERGAKQARVSVRLPPSGGLLTELTWCAQCGDRMWRHVSGRPESRRAYYICGGRSRRTCTAPFVNSTTVEATALTLLRQLAIPAEWRAPVLARAESLLVPAPVAPHTITPAQITEQKRRLSLAFSLGGIDEETYRRQLASLAALEEGAPPSPPVRDLRAAAELLETMGDVLDIATPDEQRQLIRRVFARCWLTKEQGEERIEAVTPTGAFGPLVEATASLSLGWLTWLEPATS